MIMPDNTPTIIQYKPTRMYTPEEEGKRTLMHPETDSDNIIVTEEGEMLTTVLKEMRPVVSKDKPDYRCLWFHVKETSTSLF